MPPVWIATLAGHDGFPIGTWSNKVGQFAPVDDGHVYCAKTSGFYHFRLMKYNPRYNPKCNLQTMKFASKSVKSWIGAVMENNHKKHVLESIAGEMEFLDGQSPDTGKGYFEIHVKGHLNSKWSEWLEGMEVKLLDNGEMILVGPIVDQAALMGILNKLSRLNLSLLSVHEVNKKG
jgi:hypothetical protein